MICPENREGFRSVQSDCERTGITHPPTPKKNQEIVMYYLYVSKGNELSSQNNAKSTSITISTT